MSICKRARDLALAVALAAPALAAETRAEQALRLSTSSYQLLHYGLETRVDPHAGGWWGFGAILGFALVDSLYTYFPVGDAWLHEEFHRAFMSQYGISSYDGVYDLKVGSEVIAVYKVRDEDLVRLKDDDPADMVRLPAAGLELIRRVRRVRPA